MTSGFNHAPGTAERRKADTTWLELHRTGSVKNPSRYNRDNAKAFGVCVQAPGGTWLVKWRGGDEEGGEAYGSLDELLDDGWTVD